MFVICTCVLCVVGVQAFQLETVNLFRKYGHVIDIMYSFFTVDRRLLFISSWNAVKQARVLDATLMSILPVILLHKDSTNNVYREYILYRFHVE